MKSIRSLGNFSKLIKLGNLEEMGTFLDLYDFPKLSQEDINNLTRSTTSNEIEAVTQSLPTREVQFWTE
jgi:hypothetical protein